MPLTFGPETMAEDEKAIARGYQQWAMLIVPALPIGLLYYGLDLKWAIGIALSSLTYSGIEAGGRLHDLCIRARRTNVLLAEIAGAAKEAERQRERMIEGKGRRVDWDDDDLA